MKSGFLCFKSFIVVFIYLFVYFIISAVALFYDFSVESLILQFVSNFLLHLD